MKMRCYRKILRISYKDDVTNEEVRAKIQQEIGPYEDLLTIVVVFFFFFLACEDFGRMFDKSFPDCALFFFKWRLARIGDWL